MQKTSKETLRREILAKLRAQNGEDRLSKSQIICQKLFARPEYKEARTILFYASFDGEAETFGAMRQALEEDKAVALPIINKESNQFTPCSVSDLDRGLVTGPYGIKEPNKQTSKTLTLEEIDLVLVPGVAFDRQNYRLGRGQGYYDRFLIQLPSSVPTIGLAFDFQIIDQLPDVEDHDVPVTDVISR